MSIRMTGPIMLNFTRGPFKDLRVRQAANYAINRQDVVDLLGGTAIPEHDVVPPSLAYYGHPPKYDYDPEKGPRAAEGSRLPAVQGDVRHLDLGLRPDAAIADERAGQGAARRGRVRGHPCRRWTGTRCSMSIAPAPTKTRITTGSISRAACSIRSTRSSSWSARPIGRPPGSNWGHFESPETEALISQIFNEFDGEKRLALLTELHELEGRQAVMIFVVHDLNPRAMSPKVQGFIQAQSWFQDLTRVSVAP